MNVAARSDSSVPAQTTGSQTVTDTGTLAYALTLGGATLHLSPTSAVTIDAPGHDPGQVSVAVGAVDIGGTITYTLTYANIGTSAASGVTLTDTFSTDTSVTAANGGVVAGNIITFSIGSVAAAGGGTRSFSVRVNTLPRVATSATRLC